MIKRHIVITDGEREKQNRYVIADICREGKKQIISLCTDR